MKRFLTAWLTAASEVLARELAGRMELRPSARLPQPETAMTLAVVPEGKHAGTFRVTVDRYALHALLVAARITDGSLDADRDRELWSGMLEQVAAATVRVLDADEEEGAAILVEEAEWGLGLPSAAYELAFDDSVVLMAFTDEVRVSEPAAVQILEPVPEETKQGTDAPGAAADKSSDTGQVRRNVLEVGRVDLLLDVELETSLRFGSREMTLSAVLDLGAGDVVELDRNASDPVDLLVGDKIVARGEVVLVNGAFGLRVTEVTEPKKRLESIRCLF